MNETAKDMELKAWRLLLEDDAYRLDCPKDYHATLLQRADELLQRGLLKADDWQLLVAAADQAYDATVEAPADKQSDCLPLATLRLPDTP
ncbi:hypothetical protein D16iCDA_00970 [Pseudomonas seleniipraecipitans]|uniref:Uncharacterized protein n=1 Tax=Phytopseudomonas seleniipraecipitans TaxID=640205 RepID=A0ABY5JBH6_9GAMM|nr:hypothetical protein [Pseudomonas seleniipraecipitans]UUD64314.1 hypothetical protein D16iCDA_00970 [Pseudomonas seleniipraecipitans]